MAQIKDIVEDIGPNFSYNMPTMTRVMSVVNWLGHILPLLEFEFHFLTS